MGKSRGAGVSEKLSSYDYFLPEKLIATQPASPRSSAKLMVYERESGKVIHSSFKHLLNFLPACSVIYNDSKVLKARLFGQTKTGGKRELFLHQEKELNKFFAQIKGRVKAGDEIAISPNLKARVLELLDDGRRVVEFFYAEKRLCKQELYSLLDTVGELALPPYMKRLALVEDGKNYQSVFAKELGSVAAPTASLHFDDEAWKNFQKARNTASITLHIGPGTFAPLQVENIKEHKMHSEEFYLSEEAIELIKSPERLLAIGTTATRVVEDFTRFNKSSGLCSLFLNPFNGPKRVDFLLTNFHLPKSSLIMLVASFIGLSKTLELYDLAIKNNYKFYSYGDCMLIL